MELRQRVADLKAAIASGVRTVTYEGTMTVYRNLEEMRETLRLMEGEVRPAVAPRVRAMRLFPRSGY